MANSITRVIHRATTWSIVLSVLMIAAGVLAIVSPVVAGVAVTVIFGWLLIFSGILHLAFASQAGRPGAVVWEILLGILYGGIGFYLLARPVASLESLALAFYLMLEGVLEFVLSFLLRPLPGSGWLLFDGLVTLVIAAMMSAWPSQRGLGDRHARRRQHVLQRHDAVDALGRRAPDRGLRQATAWRLC